MSSKRRLGDVRKLIAAGHQVDHSADGDFYVKLYGPVGSLYGSAIFKVRVMLPMNYPYKSPSIGFSTRIFHPNIDEASGSVCLDVINQTWSPMYNLVSVFDTFLPQLLLYPNAADPLNRTAALLYKSDTEAYARCVKEHVMLHANRDYHFNQQVEAEEKHDQSIEQPMNPSLDLSNNQSIDETINQSIDNSFQDYRDDISSNLTPPSFTSASTSFELSPFLEFNSTVPDTALCDFNLSNDQSINFDLLNDQSINYGLSNDQSTDQSISQLISTDWMSLEEFELHRSDDDIELSDCDDFPVNDIKFDLSTC